jgi:hypothetical protein
MIQFVRLAGKLPAVFPGVQRPDGMTGITKQCQIVPARLTSVLIRDKNRDKRRLYLAKMFPPRKILKILTIGISGTYNGRMFLTGH